METEYSCGPNLQVGVIISRGSFTIFPMREVREVESAYDDGNLVEMVSSD